MPVARKPRSAGFFNFDEHDLAEIARAYGLRTADAFYPILLDGETATLLEVRSATSRKAMIEDEGRRWFLKQIPWYAQDEQQLDFSHAYQAAAHRGTGLAPAIRRTLDGASRLRLGGSVFVLFEHVKGVRHTGGVAQLHSAGEALARLHACAPSLDAAPGEDYLRLVADHLALAADTSDPSLRPLVELLGGELAHARQELHRAGWEQLPQTAVHGDVNPWNLLFTERGQVTAVLDFDNCDRGSRLRDLAEAVLTFGGLAYDQDSTAFARPFRCEVRAERAGRLVAGYRGASPHPFTEAELRCADPLLRTVFVELAALGVIKGELHGSDEGYVRQWLGEAPRLSLWLRETEGARA
ncbi:phosphotransferase [Streptomyces sp. AN091965]|uniref:phosphotransferase n=1 Tax=Streptomyces sp. AN091965 TaxID=2927803 RepID=UPI001F60A0D1|nr:phosphotransferase [Streptomyces sp. AN091965]MCI3934368.1 phosphotransferase [Streptomyces sp. AN091965]